MNTFVKILVSTLLVAALVAVAVSNSAGLNNSRQLQFISFGPGSVPPPPPAAPKLPAFEVIATTSTGITLDAFGRSIPGAGPTNAAITAAQTASSTGPPAIPGAGPTNAAITAAQSASSTGPPAIPGAGPTNAAITAAQKASSTGPPAIPGAGPTNAAITAAQKASSTGPPAIPGAGPTNAAITAAQTASSTGPPAIPGAGPINAAITAAQKAGLAAGSNRKLQQQISDFIFFGPGSVPPPPAPVIKPITQVIQLTSQGITQGAFGKKPTPGSGQVNTLITSAQGASSTGKADKAGTGAKNDLINAAIKASSIKADKPGTGNVNTAINGISTSSAALTKGLRGNNP
jgi:hypothetical protein